MGCEGCSGGCGSCGGCGASLELTAQELALLNQLAQTPFLPIARRWDSEEPVYLGEDGTHDSAPMLLAQKRLIRLDYDMPLTNFDYRGYEAYPCRGSMALTARGQEVLDLLALRGIEE